MDEPIYKLNLKKYTIRHKEFVCLGCGSREMILLIAENVVSGCLACKKIEELPCMDKP